MLDETLARIASALETASIPCMLIGGGSLKDLDDLDELERLP